MTKITKKNMFKEIISQLEGNESAVATADVIAFCEKEIAALDAKAAKAKARAAEKKAAGDALQDLVASLLTDEPQTIAEIAAQIEDEDVTVSKVTYRLSQLVRNEVAVKSEKTVPGVDGAKARKLSAYALNG